ncbi:MAG: hypothetical protein WAM24_17240 [Ignavibacteriaceae bacterium]
MERKHKIIILGSNGYQQTSEDVNVDCYSWEKLIKIKNIRDFDTIIINLLPIKESSIKEKIDWEFFLKTFDFSSCYEILSNNGEIIIIGDPRFEIKLTEDLKIPFLFWTGLIFKWDSQPGDTQHFINDYGHRQFEKYISKLQKWNYSLAYVELNMDVIKEKLNLDKLKEMDLELVLIRDYFVYNRYRNALAFSLITKMIKRQYGREETITVHGPIIFLPEISLSEDETIVNVLQDICGVHTSLPEPEWIKDFIAPGQKTIDDEIAKINIELENVFNRLQDAQKRKQDIRNCLKLLYEREFALEPAVIDTLRVLGAHVEEPSEKNKEDGWIVVKTEQSTYEGVLEIKSTKSDYFDENGRKQLLDWIDRGRSLRQKNYKGLFIGSNAVNKPLHERPWAFSDSWTKAAELSSICALKTEDLYFIYLLYSKKKIDIDKFWDDLFNTNGVFNMKSYFAMFTPKEDEQTM